MSGSGPNETWSIYVATILAAAIILVALVASLVIYQRRFVALHRSYSKQLLNAQEEERAWVAREVHDDALQRVALVVHELHDFADEPVDTERHRQRVHALRGEVEDLGVMLRRVAHRLHPSLIEQAGLAPALQGLAVDISRSSGLEVDVTVPDASAGSLRLPRDTSLILYRIAQEALRNVVKHSGATRASLTLRRATDGVELEIADAGRGFDMNATDHHQGLGLVSMAERARLAEGKLTLWSAPTHGTSVRVVVPAPPHGAAA